MKNNIKTLMIALLCATVFTGCQKEQLSDNKLEERETASKDSVWTLTVQAVKTDGAQTKGLAIGNGDTEATTETLKSIWKAGEEVKVYLDATCIGTLTATPDGSDAHLATLSGSVNTTSIEEGVTTLMFLTPRETIDYTGQVGKLLISDDATNSIEAKYHYTIASDVLVTGVSGSNITTNKATFINQQSIYRLSFRFQKVKDGPKTSIKTKSVTISGAAGHIVQRREIGSVEATEGNISVTLSEATTEPFFVAISNDYANGNEEVFSFTVIDDDGATYRGNKTILEDYNYNGSFVSIKNATLNSRLGFELSASTVNTAL